jgi:hypothetical protein
LINMSAATKGGLRLVRDHGFPMNGCIDKNSLIS